MAFLSTLSVTTVAAAELVAVEAIRDAGIERLRLTWSAPIGFSAAALDGQLTLTFDRPLNADLRSVAMLTRVAGAPRLSDDRRVLTLPLVPEAGALAYADERVVFVDLLASGPAKPPPPVPSADPPATEAQPTASPARVPVRFGEHRSHSRIVFDWPVEVGYRVERSGAATTITFDRAARLDAAKAGRRPSRIRDFKILSGEGDRSAVTLTTSGGASVVRDFRLGTKVVFDVASTASVSSEGEPPPAVPTGIATDQGEEAPGAATAGVAPSSPPIPMARPLPGETAVAATPPADAQPPMMPPVPDSFGPTATAEVPTLDVPDDIAPKPQIRVEWRQPVAAAVFRRAGRLWIVFDAPSQRDVDALVAASGGAIHAIRQLPADHATVLVAATPLTSPPRLLRDGHDWIVAFDGPPARPTEPLVPIPELEAAGGPRLLIEVAAPGRVITTGDPDVGDTLFVVPTVPLGRGVSRHYLYPMFELLPSSQGIVVAPLIDSLVVDAERDGVIISSRSGLSLSPLPEAIRAGTRLAPPEDVRPTLDLKRWAEFRPADFIRRRQALTREAGLADAATQTEARQTLGEFYLAHGLAAEASGEASVLAKIDKSAARTAPLQLLKGAAQLMQGHVEDARRTLGDPSLNGLDEAAMWRTAADAASANAPTEPPAFDRHSAILLGYPQPLRQALTPWLIDAAIACGQIQPAQHLLALARASASSAADTGMLDVLEGRIRLAAADRAGARVALERAADSASARSEAWSKAELVELDLEEGVIQAAEAIERLDALRFLWRGDSFESRLLLRLSELSADIGDYGRALRTLRQVTSYFRGRPEAKTAAERMAALFQSLYLDGAAEALPPVTAVALYVEFRELTPPGDKGHRMILALAERLIALDLPGSAATFLEPALAAARDPLVRAELGTTLARAEDLASRPHGVLSALARSHADSLPDDLAVTRRHREAKALIDLGRFNDALAVLAQLSGDEAARLRTELHRRNGDWAAASRLLGERLAGTPDTLPDSDRTTQNLDLGVAKALADHVAPAADPPGAAAAPSVSAEEAAMRLLSGDPLGAAPRRADVDQAVNDAIQFRAALRSALPSPSAQP